MKAAKLLTVLAMVLALSSSAKADFIPWAPIGTVAPETSFLASSTGDVLAYFYHSDASYASTIGMWVNGVSTGVYGLPNHTSAHGDMLNLGSVIAGDAIVFELRIDTDPPGGTWFTDSSLNSDLVNHGYATAFSGDALIPVGTYIGFEDLPPATADYDYNDHEFVFTNINPIPEPASALLLGVGLFGIGVVAKRRRKTTQV